MRRLLAEVARRGGDYVATLPLLAAFLDEPCQVSPYSPASRLFWNELYAELDGAPPALLQQALEAAFAEMQHLADMMSRYRPGNPVAALRAAAGRQPRNEPGPPRGALSALRRRLNTSVRPGP